MHTRSNIIEQRAAKKSVSAKVDVVALRTADVQRTSVAATVDVSAMVTVKTHRMELIEEHTT